MCSLVKFRSYDFRTFLTKKIGEMFAKLLMVFALMGASMAEMEYHDWELAVVNNDQIELLDSSGTAIGSTQKQFTLLKELAFDNVGHRLFVVSEVDEKSGNYTIYAINLSKETENRQLVVTGLIGDVQGLAIDPVDDVLYWTDSKKRTINFARLNESTFIPQVLIAFTEEVAHDIAIDVCRRYIYWTNVQEEKSSIERAHLDDFMGTKEILVNSTLNMPRGIAIDYKQQRLYWADKKEGIYFTIESVKLNGSDRRIIFEGTHGSPSDVAVDQTAVYWTDSNDNAVWKYVLNTTSPKQIREYTEKPMGLVTRNMQIRNYPECKALKEKIESYGSKKDIFKEVTDESNMAAVKCLNGGSVNGSSCTCPKGYNGQYCERELCFNFCIRGSCYLSDLSDRPRCLCPKGFGGERCEMDRCTDFCMNGGECSYAIGDAIPKCECPKGFAGSQCEINTDFISLCRLFCSNNDGEEYFLSKDEESICRCENNHYNITTKPAMAASLKDVREKMSFVQKLASDIDYAMMLAGLGFAVVIIFSLAGYIFAHRRQLRHRRPTIRKRIIVNKNVTPLTYRPQPSTEQCEITIENCCNMNICETPCFEPFARKKDDKNKLLANMEHHHADDY